MFFCQCIELVTNIFWICLRIQWISNDFLYPLCFTAQLLTQRTYFHSYKRLIYSFSYTFLINWSLFLFHLYRKRLLFLQNNWYIVLRWPISTQTFWIFPISLARLAYISSGIIKYRIVFIWLEIINKITHWIVQINGLTH